VLIDRAGIRTLIPHAGGMCLLDAVEAWDDDGIRCISNGHRRADHPLRRDGRLAAVHLAEYGAQAMAVHGGLLAQRFGASAAAGVLAALRNLELHVARVDDVAAALTVSARKRVGGTGGWLYDFAVSAEGMLLAEGRATVLPRPGLP
jgi:predicted hotdog family 3-hydroxylacyl-ACP dehydratase